MIPSRHETELKIISCTINIIENSLYFHQTLYFPETLFEKLYSIAINESPRKFKVGRYLQIFAVDNKILYWHYDIVGLTV